MWDQIRTPASRRMRPWEFVGTLKNQATGRINSKNCHKLQQRKHWKKERNVVNFSVFRNAGGLQSKLFHKLKLSHQKNRERLRKEQIKYMFCIQEEFNYPEKWNWFHCFMGGKLGVWQYTIHTDYFYAMLCKLSTTCGFPADQPLQTFETEDIQWLKVITGIFTKDLCLRQNLTSYAKFLPFTETWSRSHVE